MNAYENNKICKVVSTYLDLVYESVDKEFFKGNTKLKVNCPLVFKNCNQLTKDKIKQLIETELLSKQFNIYINSSLDLYISWKVS